ncbi:hypothetical protein OBV_29040 [Oscillibacter valericigenes Sjm18-20]|nr:hypothetical protein OBV_29040 [Oscillibacter valericigenes Sjm18-20]
MKKSSGNPILKKVKNIINIISASIFLCIISCFVILLILSPGQMKQFTNENGEVLKNSLSEKIFTEINGVKMGMIIESKNILNPILLFVHGGPGMPEYWLTDKYPTGLEDYFTVVWWDQRGAGLSYSSDIDAHTMTTEQFVNDTIAVTNYLRGRFGQNKIYLMAHSWGTYIGIQAVQKAPELYNAYIGVGQDVNICESEKLAYEYMLNYYKNSGDEKTLMQLEFTPYDSKGYDKIRDSVMHRAGIGTMHDMNSVITGIFFNSLGCKEYTLTEKINLWRGKIYSGDSMLKDEFHSSDLSKIVTKLDLPVYFMSGAYDYTVNHTMAEDYFEQLDAPAKGFYLFQNSAHSPMFEEPENFLNIIQKDVLTGKTELTNIK